MVRACLRKDDDTAVRETLHLRVNGPRRKGDPSFLVADNSKIQKFLGWKPQFGFADGLEQTVKWYLDNQEWVQALRDRAQNFSRIGLGKN